jgi:hypothetical protein
MRNLLFALAGLALLVACNPFEKKDVSCTAAFLGVDGACSQVNVNDAEALVAKDQCENHLSGSYSDSGCSTTNAVGYCVIHGSNDLVSNTDVKIYVYSPADPTAAGTACSGQGGTWHPITT